MDFRILVFSLFIIFLFGECTKESFITDANARLEFSTDTLTFDTIFTERGSTTLFFKVYNTHNEFIRISLVEISNDQSFFRLNVDGIAGNRHTDVEIPPNDSIYVFVEVTIDPNLLLTESPYIIEDLVRFETNGNQQEIPLIAWGQDANYLPGLTSGGSQNLLTCNLQQVVWDDKKPYVLFGVLLIDSCELVLPAGTQLYVHGGFGRTSDGSFYNDGLLYILENASLKIQGTKEAPVVIQTDRLEDEFQELPGQWGRIQIGRHSKNNVIEHAIIKNSTIGILVDSLAELEMRNTQIMYTSSSGLVGYKADIKAENSLIHSSGGNNVTIILGGDYDFTYCTFANFGNPSEALRASNFTCLDGTALCERPKYSKLKLSVVNSIIFGSGRDEIGLQDIFAGEEEEFFQYSFENCIVKVDELLDEGGHPEFFNFCENCINGDQEMNLFADPDNYDFHLDTLSVAEGKALPLAGIVTDLEENSRDSQDPDMGCYEYVPE